MNRMNVENTSPPGRCSSCGCCAFCWRNPAFPPARQCQRRRHRHVVLLSSSSLTLSMLSMSCCRCSPSLVTAAVPAFHPPFCPVQCVCEDVPGMALLGHSCHLLRRFPCILAAFLLRFSSPLSAFVCYLTCVKGVMSLLHAPATRLV